MVTVPAAVRVAAAEFTRLAKVPILRLVPAALLNVTVPLLVNVLLDPMVMKPVPGKVIVPLFVKPAALVPVTILLVPVSVRIPLFVTTPPLVGVVQLEELMVRLVAASNVVVWELAEPSFNVVVLIVPDPVTVIPLKSNPKVPAPVIKPLMVTEGVAAPTSKVIALLMVIVPPSCTSSVLGSEAADETFAVTVTTTPLGIITSSALVGRAAPQVVVALQSPDVVAVLTAACADIFQRKNANAATIKVLPLTRILVVGFSKFFLLRLIMTQLSFNFFGAIY
jgi:hypothetical protein